MFVWEEFANLYFTNLLNLISPGAGVALVVRNSTLYSRKVGLYTAFGIVSSSFIHKAYTLLGFGKVVSSTPWIFYSIKYLGAAYLTYLGVLTLLQLRKHPTRSIMDVQADPAMPPLSSKGAFRMGFIVDMLNPSASISFVCIVVATISPTTPLEICALYGMCLIATSLAWYSLLAYSFSNQYVRAIVEKGRIWVELLMGCALIYLGFKILTLVPKC